ncbi:MAG: hypothetical protein AAF487_08080 [Bacteroidota bacterium]
MHKYFRIEIIEAKANKDLSQRFFEGHIQVLKEKGIRKLDSAAAEWLDNPSVQLICCFEDDHLVGGARIHQFNANFRFPYELVLASINPQYLRISDHEAPDKYGESCGLWIHKNFRRIGLKEMIMRYKMVCANHLKLEHLYGICPRHTFDHFRTLGFIHCSFQNQMLEFPYPSPEYQTIAVKCNTKDFKYAFQREQKMMRSLRDNPFQTVIGGGTEGASIFEIHSSVIDRNELLLEKQREIRKKKEEENKEWL